jgi:anthranilate phosphoribosyltransferase
MLTPEAIAQRRQRKQQALGSEMLRFRELIGKLGSGERTSTGLSRTEAEEAMQHLLTGQVDPAQAGAFLIAHRLRRPRACEMAGMLDAYHRQGPRLPSTDRQVVSFGAPFDGRCRDAPVLPLTALLLSTAGLAVVLHGGDAMPVKYGATHAELFTALGLPLHQQAWPRIGNLFQHQGLALLHQPRHFPQAETLIPLRERIGKRPPIATLELLWSCCSDQPFQVSGFVHAPTEQLAWETWTQLEQQEAMTVKGLEGGVDLPNSRVSIAAHHRLGAPVERLVLHARDHGLRAEEPELTTLAAWSEQAHAALEGEGPLLKPLIWNGGFYLWRCGHQATLEGGLAQAEALIRSGAIEDQRQRLQRELGTSPVGS